MQDAGSGPETTGRHRRVEVPLTDTGRHRAVSAQPAPARDSAARRRHAADAAPKAHPDAVRRARSRAPQRVLAGAALVAVALAPVLARSNSALGLHDAVAAEVAAHPDHATDTLEAITRGGLIGTATSAPARGQISATTAPSGGEASAAGAPSGRSTAASSAASSADAAPSSSVESSVTTEAAPDVTGTPTGPAPGGTGTTTPSTSQRTEQEQTASVPSPDGTPDATVQSDDVVTLPPPVPSGPAPTETSTPSAPEPTTSAPQPTETATPTPTEAPAETSGAIGEIIDLVGDLIGD